MVNEKLKAIQDMYYGFSRGELEMILRKGREKAEAVAEKTLHDVKSKMGLVMF